MRRRYLFLFLVAGALPIFAQPSITTASLPVGFVGSTYGTSFGGSGISLIRPQLAVAGGRAPYVFTVSAGSLPPGVTLGQNGVVGGVPTQVGESAVTIQVADADNRTGTRQFTIAVSPRPVSRLPDARLGTTYRATFVCGANPAAQATFQYATQGTLPPGVTPQGNGSVLGGVPTQTGTFQFDWSCTSAANNVTFSLARTLTVLEYFQAALANGYVDTFYSATPVFITTETPPYRHEITSGALPAGLSMDRVTGVISGTPTATTQGAPKFLIVRTDATGLVRSKEFSIRILPAIGGLLLSQTGFTFQAIQGGSTPPPQTFRVINESNGPLNFNLTTSTTSGGSGWLSATPASGAIPAGGQTPVAVNIDAAGLAPGDYYGQINVDAPGARNSPQIVSVVLNVSPANVNVAPVITPTGLIFVRVVGQANPPAQPIRLTNLSSRASPYVATAAFPESARWFTAAPANGQVAPNQPVDIQVTADAALAAGVYPATLTIQFPQDNVSLQVSLALVVVDQAPAGSSADKETTRRPADCAATRLIPVLTLLGGSFTTRASWPTPIETRVVDDCGAFLRTGSVVASFSNGDSPLPLTSAQDGRWSGTWAPVNVRAQDLRITVTAKAPDRNIEGTVTSGGEVQENPQVPVLTLNGLVSSASYSLNAQPSPGELVSIFGVRLADGLEVASELPLKTQLQGTTVTLAGRALPLVFTSDGQVNAIMPYDIPFPAKHQLIVRRGTRYSVPAPVTVALAQPAVFTTDLSGEGQGHIYIATASGAQVLADAASPAKAGDVLVIYCAGLGPVDPTVPAGTAVPFDTVRRTVNPATVTIGDIEAEVLFAGVTPGFAGLYQINVVVPPGVTTGSAIEVVVTVADVSSPPVTIAVE